jgi:hypothetical protein
MSDYLDRQGRELLERNSLASFDALWELEAEWLEPPNRCRGGWSGVARIELDSGNGTTEAFFLKRQEGHTRRTLRHPLGEPTFAAEMGGILALKAAGIPSMEAIFYGQRVVAGKPRAILLTRELQGYRPLDLLMRQWQQEGWANSLGQRRELIKVVADMLRRLHESKLVHNALYPKHIFVLLPEGGSPMVRLIDLEKMRRTLCVDQATRRDLDSLNRRTGLLSGTDRMRFLQHYLGQRSLESTGRRLWLKLAKSRTDFIKKREQHA